MNKKFKTREEWLEGAVEEMIPQFRAAGYTIPKVHVSVGWPSVRSMSSKQPRIGECWDKTASADKVAHVFISPRLDDVTGEWGVVSTLVHEIVHAVVGCKAGHGAEFRKCALAVGLEGKMTATVAGEDLMEHIKKWAKDLGEFPHAKINPLMKPTKKQSTRLIKCECEACGYVVRTTRKWLEEIGAPLCACNKKAMHFELPDEDTDEDDGGDE
jgi:SprT-like family